MTERLTSRQLESLRRAAKQLAREKAIPLHEAHQQFASERGFKNWALMVRSSVARTHTKPTQPAEGNDVAQVLGIPSELLTYYMPDAEKLPALIAEARLRLAMNDF